MEGVGNREGRDDVRRRARVLECAVGAKLGSAQVGANQFEGSIAIEASSIPADDRYLCRLIFQYRDVWEPVLVDS
jgi:hypothetical protein